MVGFIATQMTNLQNQFWSSIVLKYMNILVAIHLANDPEVENQTLQVSHRGPLLGPLFKKKHLTKSLIINYLIKVWLHPQCAIFLIFSE